MQIELGIEIFTVGGGGQYTCHEQYAHLFTTAECQLSVSVERWYDYTRILVTHYICGETNC